MNRNQRMGGRWILLAMIIIIVMLTLMDLRRPTKNWILLLLDGTDILTFESNKMVGLPTQREDGKIVKLLGAKRKILVDGKKKHP